MKVQNPVNPVRLLALGLLALLAAATLSAAQSATPSYYEIVPQRGRISCGASAGGVSTDDRCAAADPNAVQRFELDYDAGLAGVLVEIHWERVSTLHPPTLRIEFSQPLDAGRTTAWEGEPRGRVWLHPVLEEVRAQGGRFELFVGLPEASTTPAFATDQAFKLATTFVYGDLRLPEGYTALDTDEPFTSAPIDTVEDPAAPATELVAAESAAAPRVLVGVAVSGLALAVLATPRVRRAITGVGAVLLFSRLDEDRILEHPRRAELVSLVRSQPGVAAESARRHLAVGRGTFDYHVRVLELRRLVRRIDVEGRVLLYPTEGPRPTGIAEGGVAAQVLEAVRREPGLRQIDLAARLGLPERTLRHHALWLARKGRVRLVSEGRAVRCYPIA